MEGWCKQIQVTLKPYNSRAACCSTLYLGLVAANPKLLYSSMASMKASLNPSAGSPYLVESLKCGAGHIMLCKLSLSHGSRWLIGFDSGFKHSIYYIILLDNELKHKLAHWYLIDANFGHNVLSDHLDSSFGEDERLLQRIFFLPLCHLLMHLQPPPLIVRWMGLTEDGAPNIDHTKQPPSRGAKGVWTLVPASLFEVWDGMSMYEFRVTTSQSQSLSYFLSLGWGLPDRIHSQTSNRTMVWSDS